MFVHGFPCAAYNREKQLLRKDAVTNSPCHPINEQCGASEFFATEIALVQKTYVPEVVFALTTFKGITHLAEILAIIFVMAVIILNKPFVFAAWIHHRRTFRMLGYHGILHGTHQSGIYPSVATAPIAVHVVRLFIWRHEILVAPPQPFVLVEKTAGKAVAGPRIHLPTLFCIT